MAVKRKGGFIPSDMIESTVANIKKADVARTSEEEQNVNVASQEEDTVQSKAKNNVPDAEDWHDNIRMIVKLSIEDRMFLDTIKNNRRRRGVRCTYAQLIQEAIKEWIERQS